MDAIFYAAFFVATMGLFAAPPIALGVFASIQSRWPSALWRMVIICVFTIVVVAGAAALGFSLKNVLPNFAFFVIAYAAYCFLAVICWRIRFLPLRILALLCATIPICAGYILCTIGLLGLTFIIGDYTRAPYETEQIDTGLECRLTQWGMTGGASGYRVHLYKSWSWLPFIERSVASISVVQTGYIGDQPPKDASCADAVAEYRR